MNSDLKINSAYLDEVMNDPNQLKVYENENDLYKRSTLASETEEGEAVERVRHTVNQDVKKVLEEMEKENTKRLHYTCDEVLNELDKKSVELQVTKVIMVQEAKENLKTVIEAKESFVQEAKEILKLGDIVSLL